MKKSCILILFSILFYCGSQAQDIHLSQFYNSDHLLNPAKVGDFDGDYRFIGNYRNQWREISNPISTYVMAFDKAFHYYSHQLDGGIFVARDEFAGFQSVITKVLLSAGYTYVYKENNFRIGIQPGVVFKQTDLSKQSFPDQWDFGTGNFDQSSQESNLNTLGNENLNYFDLNIGAQWSKKFDKIEPKIGFAINHINRPKDSYFSKVTERLRARKVFHTEVNYKLNDKVMLQPKLLFMWTTNANDMVLGTNVRHVIKNKNISSVYWGAHYRYGVKRLLDAVIPTVGCRYNKFDLGFSYDINVSSLSKNVERRSSFEVSIIYIAASSKSRYITLPCERY